MIYVLWSTLDNLFPFLTPMMETKYKSFNSFFSHSTIPLRYPHLFFQPSSVGATWEGQKRDKGGSSNPERTPPRYHSKNI